MPPIVLTADEQRAAMEAGSSELKFLFGQEQISEQLQAKFFHIGVISVSRFATLVQDNSELIKILRDDMDLDANDGLAKRVQVAAFLCALLKAKTRTTESAKFEGELEARQMTKQLPVSEYLAMKQAWETKWWKLEDADVPAKSFVEKRAEELEAGELKAECLTSVLCRDQDDEDYLTPVFDAAGHMKMKKSGGTTFEPTNPEELRRRIGISFNAMMFLGLRHTNRAQIQNITPQLAHRYCEYLLGEHVWGLVARDGEGRTVSTPTWALIISYDAAIRKKAYRLMSESNDDFAACLRSAWMDSTTKERFFTTPMAIASNTGSNSVQVQYGPQFQKRTGAWSNDGYPERSSPGKFSQGGKGAGRGGRGLKGGMKGGKGGRGGKGSGKGGKMAQCAAQTPEGKQICFNFNNATVRCTKQRNCFFEHVCGRCFAKTHPMYQCPGNKQRPAQDTQGSGQGVI